MSRCARSRCPRPAVQIPGESLGLCLPHRKKNPVPKAFRAKRSEGGGRAFPSQAERDVDAELRLLEAAGTIEIRARQKRYDLVVGGIKIESYYLDFLVYDRKQRRERAIDAKNGHYSRDFRRKQRWMSAEHKIDVEVWDVGKGRIEFK